MERVMLANYSTRTKKEFNKARNEYMRLIRLKKKQYYQRKTSEAGNNIKKLYNILDSLTGKRREAGLSEGLTDLELANIFANHFEEKIINTVGNIPNICH